MHTQEIDYIFSHQFIKHNAFMLWERHLHWLATLGWERAYQKASPNLFKDPVISSGHEVVDLLGEFIAKTGYVNAHLGLTSSDIIDNVRLMQVKKSLGILNGALAQVFLHMNDRFNQNVNTMGFTHWQPAAPITWRHRLHAWLEPLKYLVATQPVIYAKMLAGPVGDQASLKKIVGRENLEDNPFDWSFFDLDYPNNPFPLQSSDHTCEVAAVNWCCAVASQLHKMALDLRVLATHKLVVINTPKGHAGSSSMPHKINPYKWEKVCSICRSISTAQAEIWAVSAHNSLERTLDGSWQIKRVLNRTFHDLAYAIQEFVSVDVGIDYNANSDFMAKHVHQVHSDRDLTNSVLAGESRWNAFWTSTNNKTSK